MAELEQLFTEFRADLVTTASGPSADALTGRARRRRARLHAAAGAVAAVVAVSGFMAVRDPGPQAPPMIAPPPSASAPARPSAAGVLVHDAEAAQPRPDDARDVWTVLDSLPGLVEVPSCSNPESGLGQEDPLLLPSVRVERTLGLYWWPVDGTNYRHEQLVLADDEQTASRQVASLVDGARRCPTDANGNTKIERLDIGDEAWLLLHDRHGGEFDRSIVHTVIVRQGTALVLYFDRFGPESGHTDTPRVTLEEQKADAREVAERLCARGFGC